MEAALEELRLGRPILVTDDADRENEGDLIFAAESATAETLAFVVEGGVDGPSGEGFLGARRVGTSKMDVWSSI